MVSIEKKLFRDFDIEQYYRDRLENATLEEEIFELLKNCLEHGDGLVTITVLPDRIEIFNNMKQSELDSLTYPKFMLNLKTLYRVNKSKNFAEGMILLLRHRIQIEVKKYFINNQGNHGLYIYMDEESHKIENDKEICIKPSEFVPGWKVTVYNPEEDFLSQLQSCLSRFYFRDTLKFTVSITSGSL